MRSAPCSPPSLPVGRCWSSGTLRSTPTTPAQHGHEPPDYIQPADIGARLDEQWELEVDETRPRVDPVPEGSPHVHDAVLRAKRRN